MSDMLQQEMLRDIFLIRQQDSEVLKLLVVYSDVSVVTSFLIQLSKLSHPKLALTTSPTEPTCMNETIV